MAHIGSWFKGKKNKREVEIKSAALLVGRKPEGKKRIKINMAMQLTGKPLTGMPDWVGDARDYVAKTGDHSNIVGGVSAQNITFSMDHLFQKRPIEAPKVTMKKFSVSNMGSEEEPETWLFFTLYVQFSTDLWRFVGQMGGESFYAVFEPAIEEQESNVLTLTGQIDADEEDDEDGAEDADEEE